MPRICILLPLLAYVSSAFDVTYVRGHRKNPIAGIDGLQYIQGSPRHTQLSGANNVEISS
jgi:hypothetical protein